MSTYPNSNCTCNAVWSSVTPPPPCPAHGHYVHACQAHCHCHHHCHPCAPVYRPYVQPYIYGTAGGGVSSTTTTWGTTAASGGGGGFTFNPGDITYSTDQAKPDDEPPAAAGVIL
jgi:hypothetical protein